MIKKIDLKRLFGLLYGVTSMSPTLAARLLRHLALAGLLKFGQLGLSAGAPALRRAVSRRTSPEAGVAVGFRAALKGAAD
jgi:hypothetical protein